MPWILVVESESRHAERLRDGLGTDGWQVEIVGTCAAAEATLGRAPQMAFVNAELAGAGALIAKLSHAGGGPGVVALVPEVGDPELARGGADETLRKPFSEQDARQAARRVASGARPAAADEDSKRLTSKELFGDLLAECGRERPGHLARSTVELQRPHPCGTREFGSEPKLPASARAGPST